eukprot:1143247-Pelagomonas_calceolata.AAC.15
MATQHHTARPTEARSWDCIAACGDCSTACKRVGSCKMPTMRACGYIACPAGACSRDCIAACRDCSTAFKHVASCRMPTMRACGYIACPAGACSRDCTAACGARLWDLTAVYGDWAQYSKALCSLQKGVYEGILWTLDEHAMASLHCCPKTLSIDSRAFLSLAAWGLVGTLAQEPVLRGACMQAAHAKEFVLRGTRMQAVSARVMHDTRKYQTASARLFGGKRCSKNVLTKIKHLVPASIMHRAFPQCVLPKWIMPVPAKILHGGWFTDRPCCKNRARHA